MSGGVDSSVAAFLVKKDRPDCIGVTLKLVSDKYVPSDFSGGRTCCSADDAFDAASVCARLGITHYTFNFKEQFETEVIKRFIAVYADGGTPNPCIDCNRFLKWKALLSRADEIGGDRTVSFVATGHYARIEQRGGRYLLKKGVDVFKDQSYVLFFLTQEQLSRTLLPLGNYKKSEIRAIAAAQDFINAEKRDSQDICFVPSGDYAAFLREHADTRRGLTSGDFVHASGGALETLGRHDGYACYTIGQRKGLGVSYAEPLYVCGKDTAANTVTLGRREDAFCRRFSVTDFNAVAADRFDNERLTVCTRYHGREYPCTLCQTAPHSAEVLLDEPAVAVRGQAAVFYDGDVVAGGGIIV